MRFFCFLFVCISMASCSQKILMQEAYPLEDNNSDETRRVDIKTYYAGDAFQFISFQIDVDNRSGDTIYLSEKDIELKLRLAWDESNTIRPIRKKELIDALWSEGKALRTEKNVSVASNVFVAGVNILAGVLGGADGISTAIYGADSAINIVEQRRYYKAAQGTIEEQIDYIDEYTLEEARILPGRSASYDIHFDRLMVDSHCELVIYSGSERYVTVYELVVAEKKMKR